MGTGPLGDWGPWYPAPHMPGGGGAQKLLQPHRARCPTVNPSSSKLKPRGTHRGGIPAREGAVGWFASPSCLSSTSMGAEAAEAKHRFPIKRVYLAPALLTLKQEGLKVNSLSIPYCQLIHHPGRAGAAQALPAPAPMGLGG